MKIRQSAHPNTAACATVDTVELLNTLGGVSRSTIGKLSATTVDVTEGAWAKLPMWLRHPILALSMKCDGASRAKMTKSVSALSLDEDTAGTAPYHTQCDFECVEVPEISVAGYASVLFQSYPALLTWVRALALMTRFSDESGVAINHFTVHRLLLTSLFVASKYQGNESEVEGAWGIRSDDLHAMEHSFVEGIRGDCVVSVAACLCELLPFDRSAAEGAMAAGVIVADCLPKVSFDTRMTRWVQGLRSPPTMPSTASAESLDECVSWASEQELTMAHVTVAASVGDESESFHSPRPSVPSPGSSSRAHKSTGQHTAKAIHPISHAILKAKLFIRKARRGSGPSSVAA